MTYAPDLRWAGLTRPSRRCSPAAPRHAWSCTPGGASPGTNGPGFEDQARAGGRSFRRAARPRTIMAWRPATCRC